MVKNIFFILSMLFAFTSCDKVAKNNTEKITITPKSESTALQVSDAGYNFKINWPKKLTDQGMNPTVKYNETSGVLEIKSGDNIQIEVTDEAIGLEEIKKELSNNGMFSYQFYEETPQGFIFQAILPDGSTYFYNFLYQKNIGGTTYLFKNRDNQEFTLNDIKTMKEIAASAM